jgi:hypothetical protein
MESDRNSGLEEMKEEKKWKMPIFIPRLIYGIASALLCNESTVDSIYILCTKYNNHVQFFKKN